MPNTLPGLWSVQPWRRRMNTTRAFRVFGKGQLLEVCAGRWARCDYLKGMALRHPPNPARPLEPGANTRERCMFEEDCQGMWCYGQEGVLEALVRQWERFWMGRRLLDMTREALGEEEVAMEQQQQQQHQASTSSAVATITSSSTAAANGREAPPPQHVQRLYMCMRCFGLGTEEEVAYVFRNCTCPGVHRYHNREECCGPCPHAMGCRACRFKAYCEGERAARRTDSAEEDGDDDNDGHL